MELSMETARLKPEDMASEIGRSVTTVRNYLGGRTVPSRAVLVAWAMRTGVTVDWLETGAEEAGPDDGPGLDLRTPPGTRTRNLRIMRKAQVLTFPARYQPFPASPGEQAA